jgi:hypothetical protein
LRSELVPDVVDKLASPVTGITHPESCRTLLYSDTAAIAIIEGKGGRPNGSGTGSKADDPSLSRTANH